MYAECCNLYSPTFSLEGCPLLTFFLCLHVHRTIQYHERQYAQTVYLVLWFLVSFGILISVTFLPFLYNIMILNGIILYCTLQSAWDMIHGQCLCSSHASHNKSLRQYMCMYAKCYNLQSPTFSPEACPLLLSSFLCLVHVYQLKVHPIVSRQIAYTNNVPSSCQHWHPDQHYVPSLPTIM